MMNMSQSEIGGKVIIPLEIKNQIDYLHSKCGNKEWSGILVYRKLSGDFVEMKDFEFEVLGIYPMDIGSHSYTEYKYGNSIAKVYDAFEDFDIEVIRTGMIHTHHTMSAFFSGTDTDELKTNCKSHNLYLSLIVNFDGNYVAKIAMPSKTSVVRNYQILDDFGVPITFNKEVTESDIFILDLDIEVETPAFQIPSWFEERFTEVKTEYDKPKSIYNSYGKSGYYGKSWGGYSSGKEETKTPNRDAAQYNLFDDWDGPIYDRYGNYNSQPKELPKPDPTPIKPYTSFDAKKDADSEVFAEIAINFLNLISGNPKETLKDAIQAVNKQSYNPKDEHDLLIQRCQELFIEAYKNSLGTEDVDGVIAEVILDLIEEEEFMLMESHYDTETYTIADSSSEILHDIKDVLFYFTTIEKDGNTTEQDRKI